jgi:hypothetical protein
MFAFTPARGKSFWSAAGVLSAYRVTTIATAHSRKILGHDVMETEIESLGKVRNRFIAETA